MMQNGYRRACDRCYRYKEKCNFEEHVETCTQCERSASTCTTVRLPRRQGRRPKVKLLGPQGAVQVWEIQTHDGCSVSRNTKKRLIRTLSSRSFRATSKIGDKESSQVSPLAIAAVKPTNEEVQSVAPELAPVLRSKRSNRALTYRPPSPRPHLYHVTFMEDAFDPYYPGLFDRFYASYDVFMLGPSFVPRFRASLQRSYLCSPILLYDILKAIGPTVRWARHKIGFCDRVDTARGTNSLQRLRTVQISSMHEAFAVILLGQALAAFDLLTNCTGSTLILRYSLSSIQPWYGELSQNRSLDLDPVIITSILWDTVHCLIRRKIPVIKFVPRYPNVVDRTAGLCTALLPIFYELCVAANISICQMQSSPQTDAKRLGQIQLKLLSWAPDRPSDFCSTFTSQEILRMEAQASMYRAAGLLVCHRLLKPIGTMDDVANSYAKSIMLDFSKYLALVGPGKILQSVTFPVLMAALEIPGVSREIWKSIALSTVAPICVEQMVASIEHVWMRRNGGYTGLLFDLVDSGPDFVVIP